MLNCLLDKGTRRHFIPGNSWLVSLYLQFTLVDAFVHVVILATPAPILVRESIDQSELCWCHSGSTAEYF